MPFIIDEQNNRGEEGVWQEYEGSKFLLASSGSLKFLRVMARLQKPHRRKIDRGQLEPELQQKMLIDAMAEAVVLDWQGVQNKAKEDVPFSVAGAKAALTADPSFREFVMEFSSDLANFKAEQAEEDVKG
jgi:hypothetical protein